MQMGDGLGMIQRRFRETPGLFCFIVLFKQQKATKPHHPEIKHLKAIQGHQNK